MYLRLTSNSQYYIYTFYISTPRIWTKGLQRIFEQTAASDYTILWLIGWIESNDSRLV